MNDHSAPTESDLHAFLDNELPGKTRQRVAHWIRNNPQKLKELVEVRRRDLMLRKAIFDSIAREELRDPDEPRVTITPTASPPGQHNNAVGFTMIAGLITIIVLGLLGVLTI